MSPQRPAWRPGCPSVLLCALVGLSISIGSKECQARGDPGPDARSPAVEMLRHSLRAAVFHSESGTLGLDERRRNLDACLKRLNRVQDLRDALLLPEWRDEDLDPNLAAVDRSVRSETAQRFARALQDIFEHGDPGSRQAAAVLLSETSSRLRTLLVWRKDAPPFMAALTNLLEDGDVQVRAAAAEALSKAPLDMLLTGSALQGLSQAPGTDPRRIAAEGYANLARATGQSVWRRNGTEAKASRQETARLGTIVLPSLINLLEDSDPDVKCLALEALRQTTLALGKALASKVMPDEPGPIVTDKSRHDDEGRGELKAAIDSLCATVPLVGRALADASPTVRLAACKTVLEIILVARQAQPHSSQVRNFVPRQGVALAVWVPKGTTGQVMPARASRDGLSEELRALVPALAADSKDENVAVRRAAVEALEALGPDAAEAATDLIRAATDSDMSVRWSATRSLSALGPEQRSAAVAQLSRSLSDPDPDLRRAAAAALRRYGPDASPAIPALIQALSVKDPETSLVALGALEEIGSDARAATPAIVAALTATDVRVRIAAARLLGRFGPEAATAEPALREALKDADADMRQAASDALLDILYAPPPEGIGTSNLGPNLTHGRESSTPTFLPVSWNSPATRETTMARSLPAATLGPPIPIKPSSRGEGTRRIDKEPTPTLLPLPEWQSLPSSPPVIPNLLPPNIHQAPWRPALTF